MKIEKLPSGSYRIRQMKDGVTVQLVLPYKPTKREAVDLLEAKREGRIHSGKTFGECAREYLDVKESVLSPATIRGYESILRMIPEEIKTAPIQRIDAWKIQGYVDKLTKDGLTPKTIANYYGFISAVFGVFAPEVNISATLPRKRKEAKHMPSDDEIRCILEALEGTAYEIPYRLACYGLRRSEICALTVDDLDGNVLTINKALVKGKDGKWKLKTTKTESSTRLVVIDNGLAELIRATGCIFPYSPNKLYTTLQKTQKRLNIERFPLHYFRHYFASTMHELGIPDADIMDAGGWKTDYVMKSVYRHSKEKLEAQQRMAEHMTNVMTKYDKKIIKAV